MAAIYTLHQTEASSTQLLGNGLNYKSKALLGIRKISGIHRRSLPHDKGADEKKKKKIQNPHTKVIILDRRRLLSEEQYHKMLAVSVK